MSAVLVSQRVVIDPRTGEVRDALDQRWSAFLAAAGFFPMPVPNGCDVAALRAVVRDVRGILWTGGGELSAVSRAEAELRRDVTEAAMLDAFPNVPVIGVCRGAQHLCVRDGWALAPVDDHVRTHHALTSEGAAALRSHAGLRVNSFHNLAPVGAGRTLRAVLRADDGSIEGLESSDGRTVGILWHPERSSPFVAEDVALFAAVFR